MAQHCNSIGWTSRVCWGTCWVCDAGPTLKLLMTLIIFLKFMAPIRWCVWVRNFQIILMLIAPSTGRRHKAGSMLGKCRWRCTSIYTALSHPFCWQVRSSLLIECATMGRITLVLLLEASACQFNGEGKTLKTWSFEVTFPANNNCWLDTTTFDVSMIIIILSRFLKRVIK